MDTIARNDDAVLFFRTPLGENLERCSSVEHTWSGKQNHRLWALYEVSIEWLDVLEVKHVALLKERLPHQERRLDALISPIDK